MKTIKPENVTTDLEDYVLNVDHSCVQSAIVALPAAERASHENYNAGETVSDVYSSCTVDFAQVRYISNN